MAWPLFNDRQRIRQTMPERLSCHMRICACVLQELFPGTFKPTATHSFIRLLADKQMLRRCYTQNIDSLECAAGTPQELVVAAHGEVMLPASSLAAHVSPTICKLAYFGAHIPATCIPSNPLPSLSPCISLSIPLSLSLSLSLSQRFGRTL